MRKISAIFICTTLINQATAADWPAAIYTPVSQFDDSAGSLCSAYESDVRSEFFAHHPQAPHTQRQYAWPLVFNDETSHEKKTINEMLKSYKANRGTRFAGDIDGDGEEEEIFVQSNLSSRVQGNRFYLTLTKLTANDVAALRKEWEQIFAEERNALPERKRRIYKPFRDSKGRAYRAVKRYGVSTGQKDITMQFDTPPQTLPADTLNQEIAKAAFVYREPFRLVDYNNRLYADTLIERRWLPRRREILSTESFRVLISFNSEMQPKAECIVSSTPDRRELTPVILDAPELSSAIKKVEAIEGKEGRCYGGTLNPWFRHRRERELIFLDIQTRPWRLWNEDRFTKPAYFQTSERTRSQSVWLEAWRMLGAWNAQRFTELQDKRASFESALADYYEDVFAVPNDLAAKWAQNAFDATIASATLGATYDYKKYATILERIQQGAALTEDFIVISEQTIPHAYWRRPEFQQKVLDQALRLAAAAKASILVLEDLLTQGAAIDSGNESALMHASVQPKLVTFLLERGADPNRTNIFGKTSLMMAAHLDAVKSAKILIRHGADINAATFPAHTFMPEGSEQNPFGPTCGYDINYGNRTAIMYAAENGSLALIETLLNAGANAAAVDSKQRGALDYLSRNEKLNKSDRKMAKRKLTAAGAQK